LRGMGGRGRGWGVDAEHLGGVLWGPVICANEHGGKAAKSFALAIHDREIREDHFLPWHPRFDAYGEAKP
jgi:hypothetical protein